MKKIIIDIGHPANVHLFKYIVRELNNIGWETLFTVTAKDVTVYLLDAYKLPYIIIGRTRHNILMKLIYELWLLIKYIYLLYNIKPCIIISRGSIHSIVSSFFMGINHIVFSDTESAVYINNITKILVNTILTSDTYLYNYGKKQIRFPGYKELAYLHPNVFIPDEIVLEILGVKKGEKYAIVRFVAWEASHDIGQKGISYENKIKLVNTLSKHLMVFISSESELPEELKKYQINIPPEQMHNALAFAQLFVGESGTMASESAVLGTPNILINSRAPSIGIHKELSQRFKLQYIFSTISEAWDLIDYFACSSEPKEEMRHKVDILYKNKIDVTAFLVWFIDNYPNSIKEAKNLDFIYSSFH